MKKDEPTIKDLCDQLNEGNDRLIEQMVALTEKMQKWLDARREARENETPKTK